jgi:hypothetical protein
MLITIAKMNVKGMKESKVRPKKMKTIAMTGPK